MSLDIADDYSADGSGYGPAPEPYKSDGSAFGNFKQNWNQIGQNFGNGKIVDGIIGIQQLRQNPFGGVQTDSSQPKPFVPDRNKHLNEPDENGILTLSDAGNAARASHYDSQGFDAAMGNAQQGQQAQPVNMLSDESQNTLPPPKGGSGMGKGAAQSAAKSTIGNSAAADAAGNAAFDSEFADIGAYLA